MKYPVPTSTSTLSVDLSFPGAYSDRVSGTSMGVPAERAAAQRAGVRQAQQRRALLPASASSQPRGTRSARTRLLLRERLQRHTALVEARHSALQPLEGL